VITSICQTGQNCCGKAAGAWNFYSGWTRNSGKLLTQNQLLTAAEL
jgi:hypothetical protein